MGTCTGREVYPDAINFSPWPFAQLTYRESLRAIETCLRSISNNLCHVCFSGTSARSTLADANEVSRLAAYADFATVLIVIARVVRRLCDRKWS